MFSVQAIHIIRRKILPLSIALFIALFCPVVLHAADEHSYAHEIEQDVAEDKVYLLENIRPKVTIPSEKTLLEALFCEDGPQAIMLFQKQLRDYPDPVLDKLSTSRITAYNAASAGSASIPKRSTRLSSAKQQLSVVKDDSTRHLSRHHPNKEQPSILKKETAKDSSRSNFKAPQPLSETSKQERIVAGPTTFTLQFGSFENRRNAEFLADKISHFASAAVVQKRDVYKVQLNTHYSSKEEAAEAAKKMPFKAIVVPSI